MPLAKFHRISWEETSKAILELSSPQSTVGKLLQTCCSGKTIAPVMRGGLPLASLLLRLPHFEEARIVPIYPKEGVFPYLAKHALIIDDVWDTGTTFNLLQVVYPSVPKLALASKELFVDPDAMKLLTTPPDAWIVFPWEIELNG